MPQNSFRFLKAFCFLSQLRSKFQVSGWGTSILHLRHYLSREVLVLAENFKRAHKDKKCDDCNGDSRREKTNRALIVVQQSRSLGNPDPESTEPNKTVRFTYPDYGSALYATKYIQVADSLYIHTHITDMKLLNMICKVTAQVKGALQQDRNSDSTLLASLLLGVPPTNEKISEIWANLESLAAWASTARKPKCRVC